MFTKRCVDLQFTLSPEILLPELLQHLTFYSTGSPAFKPMIINALKQSVKSYSQGLLIT